MSIWESIFAQREWGKYPPVELVKIATNFARSKSERIACLELGPGAGANAYLLQDLFDDYAAIDISKSAIRQLRNRIDPKKKSLDLKVGCFSTLPWPNEHFDFVCDNLSIYANKKKLIEITLNEVARVLKNDCLFYSRIWGLNCHGLNSGIEIEKNTFDNLIDGPCAEFGISHFFDLDEIVETYSNFFDINQIIEIQSSSFFPGIDFKKREQIIQEYIVISSKKI